MPSRILAVPVLLLIGIGNAGHAAAPEELAPAASAAESVSPRVLASGLDFPWEITLGPDGHLWITERAGPRVSRVHTGTGEKQVVLTVDEAFVGSFQEGLLGMALHPEFLQGTGNDFLYLAYTYDSEPETEGTPVADRRAKIVRYAYDRGTGTLSTPYPVITAIPANSDHNGGRLKFGPDGKLYYTMGDQGSNQFANACTPIVAQVLPTADEIAAEDWSSYPGKVLRLNPDGSIPADNPSIDGVRSHIFAYGHRNPQGIAFGPEGRLYQAEQGPKSDDEVNLIEAGMNYGWPRVAGYQDDQAYVYGNWSEADNCEELPYNDFELPDAVAQYRETAWEHDDFRAPLETLFTVPDDYDFRDPACEGMHFMCWPTIAPSSIGYYPRQGRIPGWGDSLLVTSLKHGALYRLKLSGDGAAVAGAVTQAFVTANRYRDLAISPDGRTIYVATDSAGTARGADGGVTHELQNPGAILVFQYEDETPNAGKSDQALQQE